MPRSLVRYTSPLCERQSGRESERLQKFQPLFSTLAWIANFFFNSFHLSQVWEWEWVWICDIFISFQVFRMTLPKSANINYSHLILFSFAHLTVHLSSVSVSLVATPSKWRDTYNWRAKKTGSFHQMGFVWSHFMVERIGQWVICKFTKAIPSMCVCVEWTMCAKNHYVLHAFAVQSIFKATN